MNLKRVFSTFIFLVICVSTGHAIHAQSTLETRQFSNPREVKLMRIVKRNFPTFFRAREGLMPEPFYPIGWSKDGKFAYFTEPVDEACGCYFAKLFIIDLKSDTVLWSFDYDSGPTDEAKAEKKPYSFDSLWKSNRALFSGKLNEFQIIPLDLLGMMSFPYAFRGDVFKTVLRIVENNDEESRPYGIVSKATLSLTSKRKGKKTLFEKSYDAKPLEMKVLGFLKSPYEERIAVVLLAAYRGYEGPPHTGTVSIAGAGLTTGFK